MIPFFSGRFFTLSCPHTMMCVPSNTTLLHLCCRFFCCLYNLSSPLKYQPCGYGTWRSRSLLSLDAKESPGCQASTGLCQMIHVMMETGEAFWCGPVHRREGEVKRESPEERVITSGLATKDAFWSFVKGLFLSKPVARKSLEWKINKKKDDKELAEKEDENYLKVLKPPLNQSKSLFSVN